MRFKDNQQSIYSFQDEFIVRCPRCNACATVLRADTNNTDWNAARKFSCKGCGSSKKWAEQVINRHWDGEPADDYFHYPLWLQAPCCGHILWAYNLRHLDFIEMFVKAKLRERKPDERYGWSNKSLFSRLPKWIQSRKNREEILRIIERIRNLV